jgi:hypothetical protein
MVGHAHPGQHAHACDHRGKPATMARSHCFPNYSRSLSAASRLPPPADADQVAGL